MSLLRKSASINNILGATSPGLASTAFVSVEISSLVAPRIAASWASATEARTFLLSFASSDSNRFLASSGFCSRMSSAARLAVAAKYDGSSASALSKLFLAAAVSFCASSIWPRRFAAIGLSGCFASSLATADKALLNSWRCVYKLIKAMSALVALLDSEMPSSSSKTLPSLCPLDKCASASAVRVPTSPGSDFSAREK